MSAGEAPTATGNERRHTQRFRGSARKPALSPDQKRRQAVVTDASWRTFREGRAMIAFLNADHPRLGGRPLDLAMAGDDGLNLVLGALGTMNTNGGGDVADNEQSQAYRDGEAAGRIASHQAADCPIGHDRPDERMDWMNGFGAARAENPPPPADGPAGHPLSPLHEG